MLCIRVDITPNIPYDFVFKKTFNNLFCERGLKVKFEVEVESLKIFNSAHGPNILYENSKQIRFPNFYKNIISAFSNKWFADGYDKLTSTLGWIRIV